MGLTQQQLRIAADNRGSVAAIRSGMRVLRNGEGAIAS